jgi:hypothetical protein
MTPTTAGSSGFVVGRKRCTAPSGVRTNYSKFHRIGPRLPSASSAFLSAL